MNRLFFFLMIFQMSFGQTNLITNSGFETKTYCPGNVGMEFINNNFVLNVWNPISTTPDYFHPCDTFFYVYGMPSNLRGFQYPFDGDAYIYIALWSNNGEREYIQMALKETLIANHTYHFSCRMSLADKMQYACSNFGAHFGPDSLYHLNTDSLILNAQIKNPQDSILTDSINWFLFSGNLIAQGNEKYLTLGNFDPIAILDTQLVNSNAHWPFPGYYIDSLILVDQNPDGWEELSLSKLIIYPNPGQSNLLIEYETPKTESGLLYMYDITGNKVYEQILPIGSKQHSLFLPDLPYGVYAVCVFSNGIVGKEVWVNVGLDE